MEHWVEMDQIHSQGKSPQQNIAVLLKINMSSCNKSFKQVLSFKSDISFIYTSDSTFFTYLKFEASFWNSRSRRPEVFCKNGVLRNFAKFTRKHLCQRLFFNKVAAEACNFNKKETMPQVFSCEFCETSKNTFFHRNTAHGCFWISKKMLLKAFSDTANWICNI